MSDLMQGAAAEGFGPITEEVKGRTWRKPIASRTENLFVIKGRPKHFQGSFRARSAEFLLTTAAGLGTGDEILARLPVSICGPDEEEPDTIRATVYLDIATVEVRPNPNDGDRPTWTPVRRLASVTSHAGRSAGIGEDDLESAFGHPILPAVVLEKILLGAEYEFVPVQFEAPEIPRWEAAEDTIRLEFRWRVGFETDRDRTTLVDSVDGLITREGLVGYRSADNLWLAEDGRRGRLDWELVPVVR